MGPVSGESKQKEAVRFYYDKERLVIAITGMFTVDARTYQGLLVLLVVTALVSVFGYFALGGGWKGSMGIVIIVFTISMLAYSLVQLITCGRGAGEQMINKLGPGNGLFIEINREGLRIPAGLADLERLRYNRTWLKKIVPIPFPEIRWVYIGIGPGMEKNLVIITKRGVRLFQLRKFAVDVSNLQKPVERLADALMNRGVTVKVVWTAGRPYGHDFNGYRPEGRSKQEVIAVVDHEKGKTYGQVDREKIVPGE
jgi:hypothetical protein